MIGIADPGRAETDLAAGTLACPGCARPLQRWGHARTRTVRDHGHATLHGHAPDDVAGHRTRARWYTTKTEPSYDDMAVKLRRVIIADRFHGPCPEQATPARNPGRPRRLGSRRDLINKNRETRGDHLSRRPTDHRVSASVQWGGQTGPAAAQGRRGRAPACDRAWVHVWLRKERPGHMRPAACCRR